jgi:hypothetical protein
LSYVDICRENFLRRAILMTLRRECVQYIQTKGGQCIWSRVLNRKSVEDNFGKVKIIK